MRRQDEVLRVIDDEPRLLGLRWKSCVALFVVTSFTWGLYLVVVYGLGLRGGFQGGLALVVVWTGAFFAIRWVEKHEDVDFIGLSVRYVLSGRGRVRYSGGRTACFEPHIFEELLLFARLLRSSGLAEAGR